MAIIDSINNFLKKINLKSPNVDLKDENKSNEKIKQEFIESVIYEVPNNQNENIMEN